MSFSGTKGHLTKPKPGIMLNPLHPLSRGLVGYWLFNEGSGSRANDISGHGNHGTLKNMSPNAQDSGWSGSKFGGGLEFNGTNNYVEIPSIVLNPSSSSIIIQFKLDAFVRQLVGKDGNANTYIHLKQADKIRVQTDVAGTGKDFIVPIMVIGNQYHLIVTRNNNTTRLYLDGVESTTGGQSQSDILTIDQIGRYKDGTIGYWYDGLIDFAYIYDNRTILPKEAWKLSKNPFCNLLHVPLRRYSVVAAPPVGAIMNQFQAVNLGADLYQGAIIA